MTDSATLRLKRDAVEWRHVEGEVVALDLRDAMYLGVNPSGALLWRMLEEGTTRQAMIDRLIEEYEIDAEQAGSDVGVFLDSLEKRDILESG